jgi:hypothetical protein
MEGRMSYNGQLLDIVCKGLFEAVLGGVVLMGVYMMGVEIAKMLAKMWRA